MRIVKLSNLLESEVPLMLRALCLSMTVLVLPSSYVSADTPSDPSGNAALKYWQAFATMPKLSDA